MRVHGIDMHPGDVWLTMFHDTVTLRSMLTVRLLIGQPLYGTTYRYTLDHVLRVRHESFLDGNGYTRIEPRRMT